MSSHVRGILYQIIHKGAGLIGEDSAEQVPMAAARPWILTLVGTAYNREELWRRSLLGIVRVPAASSYLLL